MSRRAPFQVLVLPYRRGRNGLRYAILRRDADTGGYWQFIAGGGHVGESRSQAARREAFEEARVSPRARLIRLDTRVTMPVEHVCGFRWGPDVLVIPEFCFGVQIVDAEIRLSHEHTEFKWASYQSAMRQLRWDSNRTALWELDLRLRRELASASNTIKGRDSSLTTSA
jgi:dATP pyrophosphohydrolase